MEDNLRVGKITDSYGNEWYLPLNFGFVTAEFGSYPGYAKTHLGIDFNHYYKGYILGANVYATGDNMKVVVAHDKNDNPRGIHVILFDEKTDSYHILQHLHDINIKIGDIVSHEDVIGHVGKTGSNHIENTGHLHYEIRYYDYTTKKYCANPILDSTLHTWYSRK